MSNLLRKYVKIILLETTDTSVARTWVDWLMSLTTSDLRPITWKRRQKPGDVCCWCGLNTFVGVEHIIPRSAGGPKVAPWNLAWACPICNKERGGDIGSLSRDWIQDYRKCRGMPGKPSGWLYEAFLECPPIPTKQELLTFFQKESDNE